MVHTITITVITILILTFIITVLITITTTIIYVGISITIRVIFICALATASRRCSILAVLLPRRKSGPLRSSQGHVETSQCRMSGFKQR